LTPDGKEYVSLDGIDFIHPVQLEESIVEQDCVDCHAREKRQSYYKSYENLAADE
jgi:hypothetical protein